MATLQVATTKGTVTLIQSVQYLPTRYLQELGDKGGKSKVAVLQASKEALTQSYNKELL